MYDPLNLENTYLSTKTTAVDKADRLCWGLCEFGSVDTSVGFLEVHIVPIVDRCRGEEEFCQHDDFFSGKVIFLDRFSKDPFRLAERV